MLSDLRYVLRSLFRSKGFTAVTVLTLALGIGSGTAIFSVVDWVLFRSVDFPSDVVLVGARSAQGQIHPMRLGAEVRAYRELTSIFSELGLGRVQQGNVVVGDEPVVNFVSEVSANFFPMLGITPAFGRGFLPEENSSGRNQVVVITHDFWQQYFHGADDVLGRELIVDGTVCTIVGVLRQKQGLPMYLNQRVIRPLALPAEGPPARMPFFTFAQLHPGVSHATAADAVSRTPVDLPPAMLQYRERAKVQTAIVTLPELRKLMRPEVYWLLVGAVSFLYGIACLNATNLMLVRLLGRKRELSIRLALGGGHTRLLRLLALESVILSALAGVFGVIVTKAMVPLLMSLSSNTTDFDWTGYSLDPRALAMLATLGVVTSVAIAIVPALRLVRSDVLAGLKDGGGAVGESRRLARLRGTFVVLQAAFAVVLLTGAGLMARSLENLQAVAVGFDEAHRVKLQVAFSPNHPRENEPRLALLQRIQQHLSHVPGVARVAYGTDALLPGYYEPGTAVVVGDSEPVRANVELISQEYLATSGMQLKRGRMLRTAGSEVLINESFARAMFGEQDPIGQVLRPVEGGTSEAGWFVVGIVGDVRQHVRNAPGNLIYGPDNWYSPRISTFIVEATAASDTAFAAQLKRALYALDPAIVVTLAAPLSQVRGWNSYFERFTVSVFNVLAGIALVLTMIGLFSVLAYTVDRRMNEFGIRLALGATGRDLVTLVMRRGFALSLAGIAVGLAGALALTRYLQSLLYETPPYDPVVLAAVSGVLLLVAAFACALPSVRASKVDVARLLRRE